MKAPFTQDQVDSFNAFQEKANFHPFTCGECGAELVAKLSGLYCPNNPKCGYMQDWFHDFMGNWEWKKLDPLGVTEAK